MVCVIFHALVSVLSVSVLLLKLIGSDFSLPSPNRPYVHFLTPSFTCVTWGRLLLSFSEPHAPHLQNGIKKKRLLIITKTGFNGHKRLAQSPTLSRDSLKW